MNELELRAALNVMAADPAWKAAWQERLKTAHYADLGAVFRAIRLMIELAVERQDSGDTVGFEAWARFILDYAAGRCWDDAANRPGGLPEDMVPITAEEAAANLAAPPEEVSSRIACWTEYLARQKPERSFKQVCAMFYRCYGYWPAYTWPGMPRSQLDRFARIGDVPPERLHQ